MLMVRLLSFLFCLLLTRPLAAMPLHGHDVFMGSGTAGPFFLSWTRIAPGTETVLVNSLPQTRGLDYILDADAGALTFTRSLSADSAVDITYEYDPGHAVQRVTSLVLPVSFDLAQTDRASLSLDALYKRTGDSTTLGGGNDALDLTLGGGWHGAGSTQITTKLLFLPALSQTQAVQAPTGLDRMGMTLAGQSDAGRLAQFSFGFSRIGAGLGSNAVGFGAPAGMQQWTLGGRLTPSRQLLAVMNYTQNDPLNGTKVNGQSSVALTFTPSARYQILTNLTQNSGGDGGPQTASVSLDAKPTDKMHLDAAWADNTPQDGKDSTQAIKMDAAITASKTLQIQTNVAQNSATGGATQTASVAVTAQPTAGAQINATWNGKNAPGTGDAQAMNLAASLKGGSGIALTASAGQAHQAGTTDSRQDVVLSLSPRPQFHLSTGLALHQAEQISTQVATVQGTMKPASFVEFSGTYQDRTACASDTNNADSLDTSSGKVALSPLKSLQFVGTYAQNPDDGDVPHRLAQRGLGLQTTLGALSLSGGYDWSRSYDTSDVGTTVHADIGLRFSSSTQLTGSYKQTLTGVGISPQGVSVYTVGFTHNLGEAFNLSLNGTMQQKTGVTGPVNPDYTASANLGMNF